jgi:ribonuclease P protein component
MRSGRRAGRGPVVVHLLRPALADDAVPPRAGFVVGRGVGNAVTRNRTRRRLRHIVSGRLPALPSGSAVVVRALPGSGELSSAELARLVDSGLRQLTQVPA